ncbi:unnamed protein product [Fraxinus pennsylvanica]|uniref:RING-type domain-containing protein n=1 Tax=Fraxinus pennsylvanica TaxID=56036 RepID=A0AAD2DQ80_9LAMI|nr:unnamed protein product [Fraxinus pennsylvanica]
MNLHLVNFRQLVCKYIGECNGETDDEREPTVTRESTETDPLMTENVVKLPYGTDEDDMETGTSSSSGDLHDVKICAICFDKPRNCIFVPCGHFVTCHDCGLRIKDEENELCPICRRLIKKVKKLIIP